MARRQAFREKAPRAEPPRALETWICPECDGEVHVSQFTRYGSPAAPLRHERIRCPFCRCKIYMRRSGGLEL
jgi:hypothetical protein